MAASNFWEEGDVVLMKAWVNDLKKLGYTFPAVRKSSEGHLPELLPVNADQPTPKHW
jgi:hypothetical protein